MTGALCILAAGDAGRAARAAPCASRGRRALRGRRPPAQRRRVRRPTPSERPGDARGAARRRSRRAPSARSGWTTTTTSRRATSSRRCSRRRSALAQRAGPAGRHPHPRGDRRHFGDPAEAAAGAVRGVFHCFTGDQAMARRRARPRLLHLVFRDRDVSEGRRDPRGRGARAGGSAAGRDRQSRIWRRCRTAASATSRPTWRASLEALVAGAPAAARRADRSAPTANFDALFGPRQRRFGSATRH